MNCENLLEFEGLQFMPVKNNKQPIVKGWQTYNGKHNLANCDAVGIVCGSLSGGLEVIDVDSKYDLVGNLFENYKRLIHSTNPDLLAKLVVQKTKGGGYHLIYRCSQISGNLKLANRQTTAEEKQDTYNKTYQAEILNGDDAAAVARAKKASVNDKVRVLLETRGQGGFIMCYPSKGYEIIHGDYYSISEISPDERETLHSIARQFNTVVDEIVIPKTAQHKTKGVSSFEDYNNRGDVVQLLQNNGWKAVGQKGRKTLLLRPGQTTAQSSGNYDHDRKWFSVFTTSTEFEPQQAYLPYAVFAILECNKDFSAASKKLYELGFGEREESAIKEKAPSTRQISSRVNSDDDDFSFLAKPEDYDDYLQSVRDGTLIQGLTTGIPSLDNYFVFKEGNMVMTNGHDNAGKSVVVWYLALLSAMYHNWNWIIFASENTIGGFMRKMIQFYVGKPLNGKFAMSDSEYRTAKLFIESHFSSIKAEEDMYNYKDIINMVKKASKVKKYHSVMIDPYNGLKIDLSGFSKLSTHEYHYEALSDLKLYGKKNNIGIWVNHHAVTAALRQKDGEKKYPVAPQKADTEGGGKVGNKTDDFLTIHRVTQHPTEWMVTELHVRKIKDTDTGGRVTPIDSPVKLEMYKNGCAFLERLEMGGSPIDPIHSWHMSKELKQNELPAIKEEPSVTNWMPMADVNGEAINF
jgi:hypothetical protein